MQMQQQCRHEAAAAASHARGKGKAAPVHGGQEDSVQGKVSSPLEFPTMDTVSA